MKLLSAELQAHLDSGATTLCWCWRLTRRDGIVLGFTDHDRDLVFDGTTFEAAAGFTATEIKEAVGLGVDNLEVEGALQSGRLDEAQLAAGLFDDARIEIFRVNWNATSQRVLMRIGSLGEVSAAASAFTAEVRGLAHYLGQPKGRLFQFTLRRRSRRRALRRGDGLAGVPWRSARSTPSADPASSSHPGSMPTAAAGSLAGC